MKVSRLCVMLTTFNLISVMTHKTVFSQTVVGSLLEEDHVPRERVSRSLHFGLGDPFKALDFIFSAKTSAFLLSLFFTAVSDTYGSESTKMQMHIISWPRGSSKLCLNLACTINHMKPLKFPIERVAQSWVTGHWGQWTLKVYVEIQTLNICQLTLLWAVFRESWGQFENERSLISWHRGLEFSGLWLTLLFSLIGKPKVRNIFALSFIRYYRSPTNEDTHWHFFRFAWIRARADLIIEIWQLKWKTKRLRAYGRIDSLM